MLLSNRRVLAIVLTLATSLGLISCSAGSQFDTSQPLLTQLSEAGVSSPPLSEYQTSVLSETICEKRAGGVEDDYLRNNLSAATFSIFWTPEETNTYIDMSYANYCPEFL